MRIRHLLAAAALATSAAVVPHTAAHAIGGLIQPGDYIEMGGVACTLNFIYDGTGSKAGKVYGGTAAHCVDAIGEDISNNAGQVFGDVAAIGSADVPQTDWALIEIRSAYLSSVSPAMKGNPTYPTGVATSAETSTGDLVQISGYGLGFDFTNVTEEKRVAVLTGDSDTIHKVIGPIDFGDSGGPLVHVKTGHALGVVSRLCITEGCEEIGPTVAGIISQATAAGFPINLRHV